MRTVFTIALGLVLSLGATGAFAEEGKAANTVCPASGKAVDGSTTVSVKGADGKEVKVATCCDKCGAKVVAAPDKFLPAVAANKKAE